MSDLALHTRKQRRLKTFPGLKANSFMHPWDVKATESLRKVPGLDTVTKKVIEYGFERIKHLENLADNIQVTERTFSRLHRGVQWAAKILDMPAPEVFVTLDAQFNAFTYGHTKPYITFSSSLLELCDDEELLYVIGHEMGHIKCEHVLYKTVAENIRSILDAVGKATLGLGNLVGTGLALPLLDWYRKAELSADRAGLMCVQDPEVALRLFMKLAGGSAYAKTSMDRQDFLNQIRAYEEDQDSTLDRTYKLFITVFRSHPFPIMRAKHLDEWVRTGEFTKTTGISIDPEPTETGAAS
jgi:Zn-dependent protease with chaperone function